MSSLEEGIARSSRHRADPPLHILVWAGSDRAIWCGGTPALRENTPNRLRCPRCTTLLREGVAEGMFDQEELDEWLASTRSDRVLGVGRSRRRGQEGGTNE